MLFVPFVALGRYLKNSWLELRQVRWPSRKATWKMVLAIFVYTF
ncbi:preprotein translocase subunit SecE, partial [Ralstonia pseudosolanacearum]